MTETTLTPATGRDAAGRFLPGCQPGPGNPSAAKVRELRTALVSAVTPEDVRQIAQKLASMAKDGDLAAAALLFDRLWGKAPAAIAVADATPADTPLGMLPADARRERLRQIAEKFGITLDDPPSGDVSIHIPSGDRGESVVVIESDRWYGSRSSDDDPPPAHFERTTD